MHLDILDGLDNFFVEITFSINLRSGLKLQFLINALA